MPDFHVIIPARLSSTRLPGKVLLDIAGKPMIQHVYERAIASDATSVVIATDDEKVAAVSEEFGATVCMTQSTHQSGTERIAEAVVTLGYDPEEIVVCLQGDEPQMPSRLIAELANNLDEYDHVKIATLAKKLTNPEELFNPNVVKVVLNHRNYAMNFSRAPIPWDRDQFGDGKSIDIHTLKLADAYYRHIGMYAYRVGFLETYISLPSFLNEGLECLEQLRILWNGFKIHVGITEANIPVGVDTEEDLERVRGSS